MPFAWRQKIMKNANDEYKHSDIEAKWPHSAKASRGKQDYNHVAIEAKWPHSAKASRGKQDYDHKVAEQKWQKVWKDNGIYEPDILASKRPFYNLMMFPYPSAEGLHVGNMYAFCGSDIYGRDQR